jgi:3' exoribonuclease, RNase T-like
MARRNYIIDVETLDVESTSVVLSCAIIKFDLGEVPVYQDLLDRAAFVKFSVEEQVSKYRRTIKKSTLEWWSKQSLNVRNKSFVPMATDLDAADGLAILRDYADLDPVSDKNRAVTFWARGILDQSTLDSLSNAVSGDILIPYNSWYDVRTVIDLTCDGAHGGYCKVPGFDHFGLVAKHDPIHDCANDLMMILSGNIPKVEAA